MTKYNDLYEECRRANDELVSHQKRGAETVKKLLRDALQELDGPKGWWEFNNEYKPSSHTYSIRPGIYMKQGTGDILCRVDLKFKKNDNDLAPAELHVPVRAVALDDGVMRIVLYKGEKIEAKFEVDPKSERSVSLFRASLFDAIKEAVAVFRPPATRVVPVYDPMSEIDARLREMRFLARLDRDGSIRIEGGYDRSAERQMIVALVDQGYVNGVDSDGTSQLSSRALMEEFSSSREADLWRLLSYNKSNVTIRMSHRGRVRFSELQQQLKTGRDHDPTGLCLARRHLMTDLAIAVLAARRDAPLSVVFLDMNGLKVINDTLRHHAGDEAIRAYLEAVVATFGEHGEAYRGEGGDEVVVVLPSAADERAGQLVETFARQLGKDVLMLGDVKAETRLTASCGSVSTTDPNDDAVKLLERADAAQYRAKAKSKEHSPRVSTIAVGESEVRVYPLNGA